MGCIEGRVGSGPPSSRGTWCRGHLDSIVAVADGRARASVLCLDVEERIGIRERAVRCGALAVDDDHLARIVTG